MAALESGVAGVAVRSPAVPAAAEAAAALSSLFRLTLAFFWREFDGGKGLGKGFRWRFLWMASRISSMRDLNACNALTISICFCPFLTGCNSQNAFDILSPAALEL